MMTPQSVAGAPSSAEGRNSSQQARSQQPSDVIDSLGNALAGVNLSGLSQTYDKSADAGLWAASSALAQPTTNASFPGASAPETANSTNAATFGGGQQVQGRQNLLFGTDMNDLSEPVSPAVGNQGLDLFLSQSPSQTLGEEALKLQSYPDQGQTNAGSNPGLNGFTLASNNTQGIGASDGRRKNESPLGSIAATSASSRSASPFVNHNSETDHRRSGGTIKAFNGHVQQPHQIQFQNQPLGFSHGTSMDNNPYAGRISGVSNMHGQQQSLQINQPVGIDQQYQQSPKLSQQQQQQVAAPPQVLYMAVPTPDGRGQMLQPIQMVQIPGQPASYVLPTSAPSQMDGGIAPQMMVLPTAAMPPQAPPQQTPFSGADKNWGNVPSQYAPNNLPQNVASQYSIDTRDQDYMGGRGGAPRSPGTPGANTDAIASLYSAPQRPPLDALLGHVRRLSRDQVGCRLLQQALDEEGPMAATLILNEGISFWGEAMVDPFGNYLFQKILEKITAEERIMLIKSVSARLVNASLNLHGTRSVQKVVELCAVDLAASPEASDPSDGTSADILTRSLTPAAARLCIDSHGNHVIQRILLKLGHMHSKFVFDAVAASVGDVARHRHGCCVIQRCLDSPPSDARSRLVHCIVEKCLELMQDAYGNYVVQYVLDVCGDEDVHAVCDSVVGKVCLLAIQKFSSNVMEKCLERCTDRVKEMYLAELSDPERIRELMMDPFGNYVVQRALSVATHAQAIRLVEAMRPHLISSQPGTPHGQRNGGMRNTAGGRRIMAKICRRFPNFTLTAMGTPEELYSQHKGHNRKSNAQQSGPITSYPAMSPSGHAPVSPYATAPQQHHHHHHRRPQPPGQMRQPYFDGASFQNHDQQQYPNGYTPPYPHM